MPQPTAKTLTLRVPLTNAEGTTVVFAGTYQVPLDRFLMASREDVELAYLAQFARAVLDAMYMNGAFWGATIGQPEAVWGKPKPVVVLPGRVA